MRLFPILILSIFLVACSSLKKLDPPIITSNPVNISAETLEPCPILPEDVVITTFEELVQVYGNLGQKYSICANKNLANIELLKKVGNIK